MTHCPFCQSTRTHVLSRSLQDYDNTIRVSIECEDCHTASAISARATPEEKAQMTKKAKEKEVAEAMSAIESILTKSAKTKETAEKAKQTEPRKPETYPEIFEHLFGPEAVKNMEKINSPPPKEENERGWLIEYELASGSRCWMTGLMRDMPAVSKEASDGMRFARKQDAELFMLQHPRACSLAHATEHEWLAD